MGIHSVSEAAVFSVPVLFGPNYHKFREARELIARDGAFSVDSPRGFAIAASHLLQDKGSRRDIGAAAGKYIADNVGATDIIARHIFRSK